MRIPRHSGFTLIELLIVVGIVAALSVVVILALNPTQLLKQARDSDRISDLTSLNRAMGVYQTDFSNASIGSSSVVYISLPDSSTTCSNLGLPGLPTGYTYACRPTSTYRNTDGTGWLPVNLSALPSGSPFSALPLDPVNSTTSQGYYRYVTNGTKYTFSAYLESSKYIATASADGGIDETRYEAGSDLAILPSDLVGYWKMDENTGVTTADSSGNANTGTLVGSPTWLTGASCKRGSCIRFSGTTNCVSIPNAASLNVTNITIVAWFNTTSTSANDKWGVFRLYGGYGYGLGVTGTTNRSVMPSNNIPGYAYSATSTFVSDGNWHQMIGTYDGSTAKVYLDGVLQASAAGTGPIAASGTLYIGALNCSSSGFPGVVDEVRQYNRAFTAAEVLNFYNSGN